MKKKFRLPISAKGQSLVELAISLVILLYLLAGAVEFGIALFQFVQLRDAAQEGALYGSIHPAAANVPDLITRVRNSSSSPIDLGDATVVTVEVFISDDPAHPINDIPYTNTAAYDNKACESHGIKVVVSYDHRIFMPFIPQVVRRNTIPLKAEVIDTILVPPPDPAAAPGNCK